MTGDRRLRILSFTTLFPNPAEPARGIFVRNRLAAVAADADLVVVAPVNAGRNPAVLRLPFRRRDPAGFDVLHPRFAVLPGILKSWDAAFLHHEVAPQIRDAVAAGSFDLVDAHYAYPDGTAGASLARRLSLPFVLSVRGSDLEVLARDGRRGPIERTLREASAVIAVSRSLERRALELGTTAERIHVVPNGVDTARFHPLDRQASRIQLGIPANERLVLVVARLDRVKGLDLLVDAMAALGRRPGGGAARARVVGEGPERRALEEAIGRRAPERVVLHGAQSPDALPAWYAAADLVCLLSHSEGCPNVVLEALACGRPVVATMVGGIPDLVRDGVNGFLAPGRDPDVVANRLERALAMAWDEASIAADAGRSWATVAREQLDVYRRVLGWS